MDALADADDGLVFYVISIFVLGGKVSSIDLGLIVEVSDYLYGIGGVQHLDIVLVGGDYNTHTALCCLYEVVFLQA